MQTRYALVGCGGRSYMYLDAISRRFQAQAALVALCDVNRGRLELAARHVAAGGVPAPAQYLAEDFGRLLAETRPQAVIVTSMDVTHERYIVAALEAGCDVITEKPLTTDDARCRRILDTVRRTGRQLRVTFNYRYSPPRAQVKRLLQEGTIGRVLSVDFAWLLDTRHGADYFRRWHRRRENSGSLLVHKATHHFDLVNWWLGDLPEEVFAHASLGYYRPETGDELGLVPRGERCHGCPAAARCPFFLDLAGHRGLKELYLDCEAHDGYFRDRCVFAPDIDIWDSESVTVRYRGGALLSYMLHNFSPWEGYRIGFNGTRGRLEHHCCESSYLNGDGSVPGELQPGNVGITLIPAFGRPRQLEVDAAVGGHGGGDDLLVRDLFDPAAAAEPDPLGRRAGWREGAASILVGIAAWHSIDTGRAVCVPELLGPHAGRLFG